MFLRSVWTTSSIFQIALLVTVISEALFLVLCASVRMDNAFARTTMADANAINGITFLRVSRETSVLSNGTE